MKKNNKEIWLKIGLIIFGILMAGLIGEITLRILGYPSSIYALDKNTGLSILKPNSTFYWIKECLKNKVKTNSLGFHSKEYNQNKEKDVFRIIILGDSYVEAVQVPLEKTFFYLLEKKLNTLAYKKYKYEVIPFGHSGNGSFLNYLYFKKYGIVYKPDLVINAFLTGNDFRDDSKELTEKYSQQTGDIIAFQKPFPFYNEKGEIVFDISNNVYQESKVMVLVKKVAKKSVLIVFLRHKYKEIRSNIFSKKIMNRELNGKIPSKEIDVIPVDNQVYLINYPLAWNNIWQTEKKVLRKFNEAVKEIKAKFLLISLADLFRLYPLDLKGIYKDKNKFDFDKPEKLLQQIAERNQFPYFALMPIFQERVIKDKRPISFFCDGHWNELGHQWAAEAIFDYLQNHPELLNQTK